MIIKIISEYEGMTNEESASIQIESDNIKSEPLGKFIHEKILVGKSPKRTGGYKTESGTIKDKVTFAREAIRRLKSFDELPKFTQEITKQIFNFVLNAKNST